MAMTKRARIGFDFKIVISTEIEQTLIRKYIRDSKRILEGDTTLTGFERKVALVAAEFGPEAAIELDLKSGIVTKLKDGILEGGVKFSNFRVEFKR